MRKTLLTLTALGTIAALVLAGCNVNPDSSSTDSSTSGSTAAKNQETQVQPNSGSADNGEKVIRIGNISSPSGIFNPLYDNNDWTGYITSLVFDSLLSINKNAEYKERLAQSWEISDDSKTVTFHLVENAFWNDGEPFTAKDVKFTFEYMADPNYTGLSSTYLVPVEGYEEYHAGGTDSLTGIQVIDDYTISITTSEVYASILEKIGRNISIIPKHIWENIDIATAEQQTDLFRNPVGTGPFVVEEYVPDQYTVMKKNPDYFKGEPKLDKIVIQVINADTVQAQLLNGEIDLVRLESLDPQDKEEYEDAGINVYYTRLNAFQHMFPNFQNELLRNQYVRQALAYAINRQGIVDSLLYGYGAVASDAYTTDFWAYPDDGSINNYEYNPEKARELLTDSAGLTYQGDVLYADDQPVTFRLAYPSGNKAREGAATVIQQNLKDIGIDVSLDLMEFASLSSLVQSHDDSYDLALMGNGFGADADVTQLFGTGGSNNHSGYSSEEMDHLLAEGLQYVDNETRKPIYQQVAKITNEELPTIFLYNWDRFTIVNSRVKNVAPTVYGFYDGVETWDVE